MKRQVGIMIIIALASVLAGTLFNMNYMAIGGKPNPLDKIREAIYGLQSRVDSLNATVVEQQAKISEPQDKVDSLNTSVVELENKVKNIEARMTEVMTFYDPGRPMIEDYQWHDLFSVTLTLKKNASVLTMATARLILHDVGAYIRFRLNDIFTETRGHRPWAGDMGDILAIHHLWVDLPAGTYTFALQYCVPWIGTGAEGLETRLTLVLIY